MYAYLNKFYAKLKNLSDPIWTNILKSNSQLIIILNQNSLFANVTEKKFFYEK